MAKEEIVASLQNAVNRGESLERAIQTMITAGYPAAEVQDSARYVGMGIIGKMPQNSMPLQQPSQLSQQPVQQQAPLQQAQSAQETPKKKKGILKVVILVIILVVLLGVLGVMFFGNKIMDMIFKPVEELILSCLV